VTVHPFIEAEKQAGHSVKRAGELLEVSRAAFYARRSGEPGPRAVRDAGLTDKITEIHADSRGSYGAPRVHAVLRQGGERCGRRRVARLMRQAGLEGRHRRRRHRTTTPDPPASARPHPGRSGLSAAGAATSPTSPPTRAGSTRPRSSTSPPAVWSAGHLLTTCAPSRSATYFGLPAEPADLPRR
jgi:transposase InsO family protein